VSDELLELRVGRQVLKRFRETNAAREAQGARLRAAIEVILLDEPTDQPLSPTMVRNLLPSLAALARESVPSITTVKRYMRGIRATRRCEPEQ
jgi:ABC-type branched-subunit amino acid transport system ATPase component